MTKPSVIVVGAGIFGLSTALHLAQDGYEVTVFDQFDYARSAYSPINASNAASVDHNKIFRASYGAKLLYQRLAYEARELWCQWNDELVHALGDDMLAGTLPKGLDHDTRLFVGCGMLRVQPSVVLSDLENETLENMKAEGLRETQFVLSDDMDRQRAEEMGWVHKLLSFPSPLNQNLDFEVQPTLTTASNGRFEAVLDSSAGFVLSSKACAFAMWKARRASAHFVLGDPQGKFQCLIEDVVPGNRIKAVGIRTADGKEHRADLVVIAGRSRLEGGPYTHLLLPSVASHIGTACGSVATILIPHAADNTTLWEKYSFDRFPVVTWQSGHDAGGICYVLPRTEEGIVKIGYREVKYTHFETVPLHNEPVASPLPPESSTALPLPALQCIKSFVTLFMPDLAHLPIHSTRLCWYTDSLDNSFVVDFVPEYADKSVLVCTGGSGHGAKFLPVLGKYVRDIIQGEEPTALTMLWRWRPEVPRGNGLEEGPDGPRIISKFPRSSQKDRERAGL